MLSLNVESRVRLVEIVASGPARGVTLEAVALGYWRRQPTRGMLAAGAAMLSQMVDMGLVLRGGRGRLARFTPTAAGRGILESYRPRAQATALNDAPWAPQR